MWTVVIAIESAQSYVTSHMESPDRHISQPYDLGNSTQDLGTAKVGHMENG